MNKKLKIGILGYGNFGQFMHLHLKKYFHIEFYDPKNSNSKKLSEVINCDYLIFAVNLNVLESLCSEIKRLNLDINTKILDISSVKVLPLKILKKYFPKNKILGTHPLFGPKSGKNGIKNLNIVLCNLSFQDEEIDLVKSFLIKKLKLNILEMSAENHDKEMAYQQALTHFIGKSLFEIKIPKFTFTTKSYDYLLSLIDNVGEDSVELYKTIQKYNPYAKKVKKDFLNKLKKLEDLSV